MNLQRREEIRELIAEIEQYEELGAALYLEGKARDAINELLAHIDTLEQTAAERVIADGAARALPQPNDATLASLAACGSTEGAVRAALSWARRMLAHTDGPTPDYTGEGSAWVPPVEARAVVVCPFCGKDPEIEPYNWKQSGDAWGRVACRNPKCAAEPKVEVHLDDVVCITGDENSKRHKGAAILKWNSRAIHADRVLVSRDLLRQARDNCQATLAESDISPLVKDYRRKLLGWLDDALRANQGGAAT